ncbi:hypothetical protein BG258_11365 [Lysinibacillus fusiformis]|uniref:Uncharacterized protein n=1 Tax=Lysinibacillus fusiformis TaxID=28031 RepID=A0A1E4R7L8_9BACI|nr:hypothetical protein BG258_11365 [Lysinibacillus fusiformis]
MIVKINIKVKTAPSTFWLYVFFPFISFLKKVVKFKKYKTPNTGMTNNVINNIKYSPLFFIILRIRIHL